jgi:hypothetical protein
VGFWTKKHFTYCSNFHKYFWTEGLTSRSLFHGVY